MKRHITIPLAALVLGAAGFFLRRLERAAAYDSVTGLTNLSAPSAIALLALTFITLAAALFLCRSGPCVTLTGYDDAFYAPNSMYATLVILAAVVLIAAGVTALLDWRNELMLASITYPPTRPSPIKPVLTVLCVIGGISLFPIARNNYRALGRGARMTPLLLPAFACCLWLVTAYMEDAANPDMMSFVFGRMAAITALLGCYFFAAFSFEKPMPRRAVFFSFVTVFFCFVTFAGEDALFLKLLALFAVLYLLPGMTALLWNQQGSHLPHSEPQEVITDES